jgi:hypothetical protein
MIKLRQSEHHPISESILGGLERYLNHGIMPGGFLTAVLENNLKEAFGRADNENSENMKNIVGYCYNEIPSAAWGSREKIKEWIEYIKENAALADDPRETEE